jgi:hypothetical protein
MPEISVILSSYHLDYVLLRWDAVSVEFADFVESSDTDDHSTLLDGVPSGM